MKKRQQRLVGGALATLAMSLDCNFDFGGHSCSAVGFECDRTTITFQSPNDAWAAGTYTLAFDVDGTTGQCTLDVANPPDPNGTSGGCPIGSDVTLSLAPVTSCPPPVCNGNVCSAMSCTPVSGRFRLTFLVAPPFGADSSPHVAAHVTVNLSVDGKTLADQALAPTATTTEPDGAGCGTCTDAMATVTVAEG
ncbi:MAG TPA: hypothetical protein VKU41_06865 [Polyangiaceae bacterium]|nr:hypothetical protein [Polyangiaceae bacterium]